MAKTPAERMRDSRARSRSDSSDPRDAMIDFLTSHVERLTLLLELVSRNAEAVTKRYDVTDRNVTVRPVGEAAETNSVATERGVGGFLPQAKPSTVSLKTSNTYNPEEIQDFNGAYAPASACVTSVETATGVTDRNVTGVAFDVTIPVTGVVSRSGLVRPPGNFGHVSREELEQEEARRKAEKLTRDEIPSGILPVTPSKPRALNGVGVLKLGGRDESENESREGP